MACHCRLLFQVPAAALNDAGTQAAFSQHGPLQPGRIGQREFPSSSKFVPLAEIAVKAQESPAWRAASQYPAAALA